MTNKNYSPKIYSKEEILNIMNDIDAKLTDFIKSGKYQDVLLSMGNLGKYSFNNQLYILFQNPDASTVKGMKQWNYLGRSIIPGSKSIRIFAPIVETINKSMLDKEGNPILDENGQEILISQKVVRKFKASYVFDISQTTGKEIEVFKMDENTQVQDKKNIINGLTNVVMDKGFTVEYVNQKELGPDCYGLCNHKEMKIKIADNLSDLQTISTLIHECGHALAHHEERKNFEGLSFIEKRSIKEVEAESIACVVCSYLGLDTSNFNFSYITGWADGDISKFRKNMDIISDCSWSLIMGIDNEFLKVKEHQKNLIIESPITENKKNKEGELYL